MAKNILTLGPSDGTQKTFTLNGIPCLSIIHNGKEIPLTDLSFVLSLPWDYSTPDPGYANETIYQMSGELIEAYLQEKLKNLISGIRIAAASDPTNPAEGLLSPDVDDNNAINLTGELLKIQLDILSKTTGIDPTKTVSAAEFWNQYIKEYNFTTSVPSQAESIGVWVDSEPINMTTLSYGLIALRLVNNQNQYYYTPAHPIVGVASKQIIYPTLTFALSNEARNLTHTSNINKKSTIYLNYQCGVTLINAADRASEFNIGGSTLTFRFYTNNSSEPFDTRVIELPMEESQARAIGTPLVMDFGDRNNVKVVGTLETGWSEDGNNADFEVTSTATNTHESLLIQLSLSWVSNITSYGTTSGINWSSTSPSRAQLTITGEQANVSGIVTTLYNLTARNSKVVGQRINNNTTLTIYKTECVQDTINRFVIISELSGITSNYLYIELPVGNVVGSAICVQYSDSGEEVTAFSSYTYEPTLHVTLYSTISFNYKTFNAPSTTIPITFKALDGTTEVSKDVINVVGREGTVNNVINFSDANSYITIDEEVYNKRIQLGISEVSGVISIGSNPSYEYNAKYKSNNQTDRNHWVNIYADATAGTNRIGVLTNVVYSLVGSGWYPADPVSGLPAYLQLSNGAALTLPGIFGNHNQLGRSIEMLVQFNNCLDTSLDCITANYNGVDVFAISPDRVKVGYQFDQSSKGFAAAPISYGRWVHIVIVMEGEGVNGSREWTNGNTVFYSKKAGRPLYTNDVYFHIYVDGTRSSSKTMMNGAFNYNSDINFSSNSTNINIAFVRAYDQALTSDQVLGLSNTAYGSSETIGNKIAKNNLLETIDTPNINFTSYNTDHAVLLIDGDMRAFNNSLLKKDAIVAKYHALFPGRESYVTKDMITDENGNISLNTNNRFSKNILSLYPEDQIQGTSSRVYPIHNIRWYMKMKSLGKRSSSPTVGDVGYTDNTMTWYPVYKKSKNIYKYPTNCVLYPDYMAYNNGILTFSFNHITYASVLGSEASNDVIEFQVNASEFTSTTNNNRKLTTDISFTYNGLTYYVVLLRAFVCEVLNAVDKVQLAGEYKKGTSISTLQFDPSTHLVTINEGTETEETFSVPEGAAVVKIANSNSGIKVHSGFALTEAGDSKVFCLKADFVDSSQTHNTGTCSALNSMYDTYKDFAPPSHSIKDSDGNETNYQSGIEGLPIDVFWINTNPETPGRTANGDGYYYWQDQLQKLYYTENTPNYLGKYMLNQDKKSSGDLFGLYEFTPQEGGLSYYDHTVPNLCIEVGTNRLLWTNWIPEILKGSTSLYDVSYPGDYKLNWNLNNNTGTGWTVQMVKDYFDSTLVNTHNDSSDPANPKEASGDGDSSTELCWEVRNYNVPVWDGNTLEEVLDYADGETLTDLIDICEENIEKGKSGHDVTMADDIAQQWAELCQYIWVSFTTTPGFRYWDSKIMNYDYVLCGFKGWKTDIESWRNALYTGYWTVVPNTNNTKYSHYENNVAVLTITWNSTVGGFIYEGGIYAGELYWPKSTDELNYGSDSRPVTASKIYLSNEFLNTVSKHFNVKNLCLWYIYTEIYLALDQRTKNCTLATWDVQLRATETEKANALNTTNLLSNSENGIEYAHWNFIPYDSDTVLGVNNNGKSLDNEGNFTIPYTSTEQTLDNTGNPNFAGHSNCLWKLVRDTLYGAYGQIVDNGEIPATLVGAASVLLTNKSKNAWKNRYNQIANNWPDIIYNKDQELKYLLPITEWSYSLRNANTNTFTTSFIDNIQGTAYLFRNTLIDKCYSYLYGKYGSEQSDMCGFRFTKAESAYDFSVYGILADKCWVNGQLSSIGTHTRTVSWHGDVSSAETTIFSGVENMSALILSPNQGNFNLPAAAAIEIGDSFDTTALSKLETITFDLSTLGSSSTGNVMNLEGTRTNLIGLKHFHITNPTNTAITCHWNRINLATAQYMEDLNIDSQNSITLISTISSANLTELKIPYPTQGITIDSCTSLIFDRDHPNTIQFYGPTGYKFGSKNGNTNSIALITIKNSPGIDIDYFLERFCIFDAENNLYPKSLDIDNYNGDGHQLDLIRAVLAKNSNWEFNHNISKDDFVITINSFKYLQVFDEITYMSEDSELFSWIKQLTNLSVNIPDYTGIKFTEYTLDNEGNFANWINDMYNITNLDNNTGYGSGLPDYKPSGHIGIILNKRHAYVGKYKASTDTEILLQLDDNNRNNFLNGEDNSAQSYIRGGSDSARPVYDVWIKEPEYYYKGVNDYQNGVRYIFFSTNDKSDELPTADGTIPEKIAAKGLLIKLEDLISVEYGNLANSSESILYVPNYYIASNTTINNLNRRDVSLLQNNAYNTIRIDISGYDHIQFPAYWVENVTCLAIVDSNNIVRYTSLVSTLDAQSRGYTLYSPFLYHNKNKYKYLYVTVPSSLWDTQSAGGFDDTYLWNYIWMTNSNNPVDWEPFWVFHKESLGGVYEASSGTNSLGLIAYFSRSNAATAYTNFGIMQENCYRRGASNENGGSFHAFSYEQSKDVANLYYAKYGCRNSQWQCGTGTWDYQKITGLTDFLGMRDTAGHKKDADYTLNATSDNWYVNYKNDTNTSTSFSNGNGPKIAGYYKLDGTWGGTVNSTNVMGYDNFQGDKWEVTGNSWWNLGTVNYLMQLTKPHSGLNIEGLDTPNSDLLAEAQNKVIRRFYNRLRGTSGGTIALMRGGRYADTLGVYSKETARADSYGDGHYYANSANRCLGRSGVRGDVRDGVALADLADGSAAFYEAYGSRLSFSGNIEVAESLSAFLDA